MRNWRKLLLLMGRQGRNLPLQTVSFTTDWYVDLQNKILPGCKVRFTEICIYSIQKYEAVPVMSSSAQHVCLTLWPYWGMQICKVLCHPEMPQVCIMFSHMLSFCLLCFSERPLHYQERVLPIVHSIGTESHLLIKKHAAMEAITLYLCKYKTTESLLHCLVCHIVACLHQFQLSGLLSCSQ